MAFAHLHNHTIYSTLDGAASAKLTMQRLQKIGMTAWAKTDHGTMSGVVEFVKAGTDASIKVIPGMEIYEVNDVEEKDGVMEFAPSDCRDPNCKNPAHQHTKSDAATDETPFADKTPSYFHLTMLARNRAGYEKLIRLCSAANVHGFHRRPRADRKMIEEICTGDDIIVGTGCPLSRTSKHAVRHDTYEKWTQAVDWYRRVFGGDNVFAELMSNGFEHQPEINQKTIEFGNRAGMPIVVTNDAHYVDREHARLEDIILCIGMGMFVDDPTRRFKGLAEGGYDGYYLKTEEELKVGFAQTDKLKIKQEWLDNSQLIADRCEHGNYIQSKGFLLPQFNARAHRDFTRFTEWTQRHRAMLIENLGVSPELLDEVMNVASQ